MIKASLRPFMIPLAILLFVLISGRAGGAGAARPAPGPAQPAACPGQTFTDVCPADWFYPFVMDLYNLGAISGYADQTFRPNNEITRGQIMKVVVIATGLTGAVAHRRQLQRCADHAAVLHAGSRSGWRTGWSAAMPAAAPGEPCDPQQRPYFRPGANVNRGQMAKMIVNARHWPVDSPPLATFADVPLTSPYFVYVERVAAYDAISGYGCGGTCAEPCPGVYFRPVQHHHARPGQQDHRPVAHPDAHAHAPQAPRPTRPTRTPTRRPTGTRRAALALFPADNIWNRNIAALPTHALSDAYIASIGAEHRPAPRLRRGAVATAAPSASPTRPCPATSRCVPISFY